MVTLISCIIGDGLTSEPCYVSRWKGCLNKKYSTGESVGNGGSKIEPRKFVFLVFFFFSNYVMANRFSTCKFCFKPIQK